MKEKIKVFILNIMIGYFILFVILMITNIFNFTKTIYVSDDEERIQRLDNVKEIIDKQEDSVCKNIFIEMVDSYELTSYEGDISITKIYEDYNKIGGVSYYNDLIDICGIPSEVMVELKMPEKFMSSMMLFSNLFYNLYIYEYELDIKDYFIRYNVDPGLSVNYNLSKDFEIDIIETIVNYYYGGEINE